jgi:hypothetical protein
VTGNAAGELSRLIEPQGVAAGLCTWAFVASAMAGLLDWPEPDADHFRVAAQINATLLVAAAIAVAVPPAWDVTTRTRFTWVATATIVVFIGLAASLIGSLEGKQSEIVFVLSISPLPPMLIALLLTGHAETRQSRRESERDTASG